MSKVSISEVARAPVVDAAQDFVGSNETRAFFKADRDPIQVYQNRLEPDATMRIGPSDEDSITYVWQGGVEVAGQSMPSGSSFIVERGASADVSAGGAPSVLLTFFGNTASRRHSGGRIHLLPLDRVPRGDLGHE